MKRFAIFYLIFVLIFNVFSFFMGLYNWSREEKIKEELEKYLLDLEKKYGVPHSELHISSGFMECMISMKFLMGCYNPQTGIYIYYWFFPLWLMKINLRHEFRHSWQWKNHRKAFNYCTQKVNYWEQYWDLSIEKDARSFSMYLGGREDLLERDDLR